MFQSILDSYGLTDLAPQQFGAAGVGLGVLLVFFGLAAAATPRNRVATRMAAQGHRARKDQVEAGLLRPLAASPKGLMKSLIPANDKERTLVQRQLAQAGANSPHAVRNFYLVRLILGIGLPAVLLGAILAARANFLPLPDGLLTTLNGLGQTQLLQITAVLVWIGFFGPAYWLKARASARRDEIRLAFPNALDLIQISVEAGLGIDAALVRVGNELADVAPALSQEILIAQREIQAGRNRDKALLDMAARTQVEEVGSFVNVVLQSIQFGANISEVLVTYAAEMRQNREIRAQEKTNRMPVQMSAVMASLMLPALLLLTIGPVALRYIRYFAE